MSLEMVGRVGNQPGSLGWCGLDPEVAEGNTSSHRWGERQDHLPTGHEGAGTRMISMVKKNHRKVEASQMEPKRSKKDLRIVHDLPKIFHSATDIFCPKLVQPGCAGPFGPVDAWGPRHDERTFCPNCGWWMSNFHTYFDICILHSK